MRMVHAIMIQLEKYYLCDKNNNKLVEFKARICPQGIIIYNPDKIEVLSPDWKLSKERTLDWLDAYIQSYEPLRTGPFLDERVKNDLYLSEEILCNGRLDGLFMIDLLLTTHFKSDKYYITAEEPVIICFATKMIGFNRLFIDKPVNWEELN